MTNPVLSGMSSCGPRAGRSLRVVAAILTGTAVALLAACGGKQSAAYGGGGGAVPVTAADVIAKTVPEEITAIGTVVTAQTVGVKAQVGGQLFKVAIARGQDVRKGQLLFEIDPRPYQVALDQAEAQLARDQALLANAESDVKRYSVLVKEDYVTEEQYDQTKANAESLQGTVKADRAAVENARLNLSYCTITSPIDGRAGDILVDEGNLVKANADTPMVVLNLIEPIDVSFSVPEANLGEIRARREGGDLAVVARLRGGQRETVEGRLTFINNTVDIDTGTITLRGTFPNKRRLLWPGQFVDVVLTLGQQQGALVVPNTAVVRGQEGLFVYIIKPDDTVESRSVEVDRTVGRETVIAKGLTAGEKVVSNGQLRLVPGAKVEIKQAGQES
jgi:multidrug efflux system membrane fusion protein